MLKILHFIRSGCGAQKDNITSHYFSKHYQKTVKSLIYLRTYRNLVVLLKKILDVTKVMSIMWYYSLEKQKRIKVLKHLIKINI